jgi:hypothetical protein
VSSSTSLVIYCIYAMWCERKKVYENSNSVIHTLVMRDGTVTLVIFSFYIWR